MASHGHFHWNERMTRDAESIKAFYQDTIGWTFDAMQTPDGKTYWVAIQNGQPVAGSKCQRTISRTCASSRSRAARTGASRVVV